jgi:hypothetical protein
MLCPFLLQVPVRGIACDKSCNQARRTVAGFAAKTGSGTPVEPSRSKGQPNFGACAGYCAFCHEAQHRAKSKRRAFWYGRRALLPAILGLK